ncbi:MAG: hypothetical protein JXL84_18390, partial [Deltaproteobacteria bacterium]|nr:hypothetical protein [Deltaproteobacteria bacterium]
GAFDGLDISKRSQDQPNLGYESMISGPRKPAIRTVSPGIAASPKSFDISDLQRSALAHQSARGSQLLRYLESEVITVRHKLRI